MSQPECSVLRRHHEQMIGTTAGSTQEQTHSVETAAAGVQSNISQSASPAATRAENSGGLPWSKIAIAVVCLLVVWVLMRKFSG